MIQKIGSIGWALDRLSTGAKVTRRAWDNGELCITHVPEKVTGVAEKVTGVVGGEFRHGKIYYREHYSMQNVDGVAVLWNCSQEDLINEDYEEVA